MEGLRARHAARAILASLVAAQLLIAPAAFCAETPLQVLSPANGKAPLARKHDPDEALAPVTYTISYAAKCLKAPTVRDFEGPTEPALSVELPQKLIGVANAVAYAAGRVGGDDDGASQAPLQP